MTWARPKPADIVWCYVPYDHPDGTTSLVRHPALVLEVDDGQTLVQVAVAGGTSFRKTEWSRIKRARKAWDLLMETQDPWFAATGLANDTLFHMQRRYILPYTPEHFFAPAGGSPKLGSLDGSHPELRDKVRRAMLAAQSSGTNPKR